jgi:MFS family permease
MLLPRPNAALYGIVAAVFISGTGIGSLLPVLPLYLRDRGSSYSLLGVIVGASLVAQAVGQWPAGWLSERVGRKEIMVAGLLVSAISSLLFVVPMSVEWLIALRFLQGLGFAAAAPAELAAVADAVPSNELGVAYGWVSGARQAGYILGPAIGGFLAVFGRWTVFVVTGIALLGGALVVAIAVPKAIRQISDGAGIARVLAQSTRVGTALRAVAVMTIGVGLLIGIYDVVWSLFMRSIGASDFVIGLSFTLFALPLVVATPFAGWASDRWDRRWLMFISVIITSLLAPVYPFIRSIPLVFGVGLVEGATWGFTEPATNAFLMDAVSDRRGEAQGIVGTARSAAMAVGSLVAGGLFAYGVAVPFWTAGAAGVLFALAALPGLRAAGRHAVAAEARP